MINSTVSAHELSEWIGVSERHVRRLAPILKQDKDGKFDLKASIRAYCVYARSEAKLGGSPALLEQRIRVAKANADRKEFENDLLRKKYLHAEKTLFYLTGISIAIKNSVMAVAAKVAPQVAGLTAPEVYVLIEKYLSDALEQVSNLTQTEKGYLECVGLARKALPGAKFRVEKRSRKKDGGRAKKRA
jgi:phage terminase Nu1 subunit (DNA packaging protein)